MSPVRVTRVVRRRRALTAVACVAGLVSALAFSAARPPGAGAGSTIGMLMAPARVDRVASFNAPLAGADYAAAEAIFAALEAEAMAVLRETGAEEAGRVVRRLADMRYIGQGSEITVELPDRLDPASVAARFEAAYRALFARTPPGAAA